MARTRSQIGRNNRRKGQVGEREARQYLQSLGFDVPPRNIQPRGGKMDGTELVVDGVVCVEVKRDQSIGLGTKALTKACEQASRDSKMYWAASRFTQDSGPCEPVWIVLWRPDRSRQWLATFVDREGIRATIDTDKGIKWLIENLKAVYASSTSIAGTALLVPTPPPSPSPSPA